MSRTDDKTIIALDMGDKRIGVARAYYGSLFPSPCTVIEHNDSVVASLLRLFKEQEAVAVVVGLPRNLSGDDTAQTRSVRAFVARMQQESELPFFLQDEAGTSKKAAEEIAQQPRKKASIDSSKDALAATYILEDFIQQGRHHDLLDKAD